MTASFPLMAATGIRSTVNGQSLSDAELLEWVDEEATPALISSSRGRFYAHCVKFGIAGSGDTADEAIQDVTEILIRYLAVSFSEGRSYKEATKPAPIRIRLQSWYLRARAKASRKVKPSLSRLGGLTFVPTIDHEAQRLAH